MGKSVAIDMVRTLPANGKECKFFGIRYLWVAELIIGFQRCYLLGEDGSRTTLLILLELSVLETFTFLDQLVSSSSRTRGSSLTPS